MDRAKEFIGEERVSEAVLELKNALKKNPENPEARYLLGVSYWKLGVYSSSEKELRRAQELGVVDEAVLPVLARVLYAQRKFDDLSNMSGAGLSDASSRAQVMAAKGLGRLASDDKKGAGELIAQALDLAPGDSYVMTAKARLVAAQGDKNEAYRLLEDVLDRDPSYAPAWSLLGQLYRSDGNLLEAEKAFSKAIDNRLDNTADYMSRLLVLVDQRKFDDAKKDLDVLIGRIPGHPTVRAVEGLIYFYEKNLDDAKVAFELSLKADDRQVRPKLYLAIINFHLGNLQQAESYAEQAFGGLPGSVAAREVLAAIKIRKRDYEYSERLLRPIVEQKPDDFLAVNLMVVSLLGQGRAKDAVPFLRKIVDRSPEDVVSRVRLGAILLASGEDEKGIAELKDARRRDPSYPLIYRVLVGYYLEKDKVDEARSLLEEFGKIAPRSAEPWVLLGGLEFEKGEDAAAYRAFEEALRRDRGNLEANRGLALLAIKNNDYEEARKRFQDALSKNPEHLSSLLGLAVLYAKDGKEKEMLEYVRRAIEVHPEAVTPRVMMSEYYLSKGEPEKVAPLMLPLEEEQQDNPVVLKIRAWEHLAKRDFVEARLYLERLVGLVPDSARLHFLLAKAYAGEGNERKAREHLERVVSLSPDSLAPRLALARLALIRKDLDAAEEQIRAAENLSPNDADVVYMKGVLANATGDDRMAEQLMQQVFEMAPNTRTMLAFARQKWRMGRFDEALNVQRRWVEKNPDDILASLALSGVEATRGMLEEAIDRYQDVLAKDPENVVALNNMAWYMKDKEPEKAMGYARKAADLEPGNIQVLDTLAMVQLAAGQDKKATETMEKVLLKAPKNPTFLYHMALIKKHSGAHRQALDLLESALRGATDFPERKAAERLYEQLKR